MTKEEAQRVWDTSNPEHQELVYHVLQNESCILGGQAVECYKQGLQKLGTRLLEGSDTYLAAAVLLGYEESPLTTAVRVESEPATEE